MAAPNNQEPTEQELKGMMLDVVVKTEDVLRKAKIRVLSQAYLTALPAFFAMTVAFPLNSDALMITGLFLTVLSVRTVSRTQGMFDSMDFEVKQLKKRAMSQ